MNPHARRILKLRSLASFKYPLAVICAAGMTFAVLFIGVASAQEKQITLDHITAAVCQVETGTIWQAPGVVRGDYRKGAAGELGPWQVTGDVLSDLSVTRPWLVHSDVAYAERIFCRWYLHLLGVTGSHREALAAYHRGLKGRHRKEAKAYAERALNLAHRLASESN